MTRACRSLNEVEAEARKAARGAGYSWGLAEEAGMAARWLCARGFDGCGALARVLAAFDGAPDTGRPEPDGGAWRAGRALCPVQAGAALSDMARLLPEGRAVLIDVFEPLVLLPFLAHVSDVRGHAVRMDLPGCLVQVTCEAARVRGVLPGRASRLGIGPDDARLVPDAATRAFPAASDWDRLAAFAARTYAPATETSRLKGAGAGLSDND